MGKTINNLGNHNLQSRSETQKPQFPSPSIAKHWNEDEVLHHLKLCIGHPRSVRREGEREREKNRESHEQQRCLDVFTPEAVFLRLFLKPKKTTLPPTSYRNMYILLTLDIPSIHSPSPFCAFKRYSPRILKSDSPLSASWPTAPNGCNWLVASTFKSCAHDDSRNKNHRNIQGHKIQSHSIPCMVHFPTWMLDFYAKSR